MDILQVHARKLDPGKSAPLLDPQTTHAASWQILPNKGMAGKKVLKNLSELFLP
jgi:hypothetical protein